MCTRFGGEEKLSGTAVRAPNGGSCRCLVASALSFRPNPSRCGSSPIESVIAPDCRATRPSPLTCTLYLPLEISFLTTLKKLINSPLSHRSVNNVCKSCAISSAVGTRLSQSLGNRISLSARSTMSYVLFAFVPNALPSPSPPSPIVSVRHRIQKFSIAFHPRTGLVPPSFRVSLAAAKHHSPRSASTTSFPLLFSVSGASRRVVTACSASAHARALFPRIAPSPAINASRARDKTSNNRTTSESHDASVSSSSDAAHAFFTSTLTSSGISGLDSACSNDHNARSRRCIASDAARARFGAARDAISRREDSSNEIQSFFVARRLREARSRSLWLEARRWVGSGVNPRDRWR